MNRHDRRAVDANARSVEVAADFMKHVVGLMAQRGPAILDGILGELGREPKPGEVGDVLVTKAAEMERALLLGEFREAMNAAIAVLFLARDLAVRDGRIKTEEVGQA